MTLRDNISATKRLAHMVLDQVKAGLDVHPKRIAWALVVLGDWTPEQAQ